MYQSMRPDLLLLIFFLCNLEHYHNQKSFIPMYCFVLEMWRLW